MLVELIGDELDEWRPPRKGIGTVAGMRNGCCSKIDGLLNRTSRLAPSPEQRLTTKEKWKDSQKEADKEMQLQHEVGLLMIVWLNRNRPREKGKVVCWELGQTRS